MWFRFALYSDTVVVLLPLRPTRWCASTISTFRGNLSSWVQTKIFNSSMLFNVLPVTKVTHNIVDWNVMYYLPVFNLIRHLNHYNFITIIAFKSNVVLLQAHYKCNLMTLHISTCKMHKVTFYVVCNAESKYTAGHFSFKVHVLLILMFISFLT